MDAFHTEAQYTEFYDKLVRTYKVEKAPVTPLVIEKFAKSEEDINYSNNLYRLKVALETTFMRDVHCQYKYVLVPTPKDVGCDIREQIFNITDEMQRASFLQSIKKASRYFIEKNAKIPHILTDIDDTLYPSASIIETSGRDTSWVKHQPYPGIYKFYDTFYENIKVETARYTTVLTATPVLLKETKLEDETLCDILGPNFGFIQGADSKRQAIASMFHNERPIHLLSPSSTQIGNEKYRKFKQYAKIFPEYRLFFIGDNGQGDLIAGKMMLADPECPEDLIVCIHNIIYEGKFLFTQEEEQLNKDFAGGTRLYFFKNYLELAYIFTKTLKIFTQKQYLAIKEAAIEDIKDGLAGEKTPINKNLYQHFSCVKKNSNMSPESCISESELLTTRKTVRKRISRFQTRKALKLSPRP
jgi:hypothetical protein